MEAASTRQRAIRNLFFFLYLFDGIILLASGQTIGDHAAGTVVLSQKDPTAWQPAPAPSGRKTKTIVIALIAAAIIWIAAIFGIVLLALDSQKDSEEYQLAYQYLISSSAFEELNADESSIFMNQYSSRTTLSPDGGSPVKTVQIGFLVNSRSFEVVCHQEDGVWRVCGDCTSFD